MKLLLNPDSEISSSEIRQIYQSSSDSSRVSSSTSSGPDEPIPCMDSCCRNKTLNVLSKQEELLLDLIEPKDPKISLYPEGIKNIDFSALTPNVTLSLGTVVAIENPNYGSFKYKNTTSYVTYHGEVVGEAPIEQRYVRARHKL
ncbi:hypothetical protein CFP56_021770 [Quercus suber]|uniref:Uncharacterized protein n=1 Tax=Quercus suber TaxID=58331 RepID=A0AAW0KCL1_QUESU